MECGGCELMLRRGGGDEGMKNGDEVLRGATEPTACTGMERTAGQVHDVHGMASAHY